MSARDSHAASDSGSEGRVEATTGVPASGVAPTPSAARTHPAVLDAYERGFRDGIATSAEKIAEPYPEDIFTPMTDDEVALAVAAMNEVVPHASERMHARWARHLSLYLHDASEAE